MSVIERAEPWSAPLHDRQAHKLDVSGGEVNLSAGWIDPAIGIDRDSSEQLDLDGAAIAIGEPTPQVDPVTVTEVEALDSALNESAQGRVTKAFATARLMSYVSVASYSAMSVPVKIVFVSRSPTT